MVIGLDGATFDILDPMIEAGQLPTLASLVAHGARAPLRSVVPPITPAAWASFMTGKTPGRHGIYDFRVFDPRTQSDAFVTSRALRDPSIWELATAAGLRVGVVGLPMMYPPGPGAGTVVTGFDTPSIRANFTWPPELRERILAMVPDYQLMAVSAVGDPTLQTEGSMDEFLRAVERSFEQRTALAVDLLREKTWDLFMLHHQDVDALQHRAWGHIVAGDSALRDRLHALYGRLDAFLADILEAVPSETLVFVVSDHGFGSHEGRIYPNRLLANLGYLRRRRRPRLQRLGRSLQKRLARLGIVPSPPAKDTGGKTWMARTRERSFDALLPLDWHRTQAYVAVAEIYGLLYLNLRGREPQGIVEPGDKASRLREAIRSALRAQRSPRDGEPIFSDIVPGETVYPENAFGRRPDLVLIPRPGLSMTRDLAGEWIEYYHGPTGTHRPEGILILSGDGVRTGTLPQPVDIIDLAPTILAVLGLSVPSDMEGCMLRSAFLDPPPVEMGPPTGQRDNDANDLTDAEEAEVTKRLQSLGYMA